MTDAERDKWVLVRQRGRLSFVLRHGIVKQGLLFATVMMLPEYFEWFGGDWDGSRREAFRFVFFALFFGIPMGFISWQLQEQRYLGRGTSDITGPDPYRTKGDPY